VSIITLSAKAYNNFQLKFVDKLLKAMLRDLKVETQIHKFSHGWIQIAISGEDEKAALHYLAGEIGFGPKHLENLERFSTVKGYITSLSRKELYIDMGVFSSNIVNAVVSLKSLQAQLADGRKMSLEKIAELFGFVENLPFTVKILKVDLEKSYVEAVLSEKQLDLYRRWTKSLLDRLVVLGASFNRVEAALKRTSCNRDVVNIETLGLFENAVVCKLGTDAVGLIPKIGRRLWKADFSIFNPKKIVDFLGDYLIS